MTTIPQPAAWFALVRNFWRIIGVAFLAAVVCTAAVLMVPRRYEASMTLAAVTTQRLPAGAGALAGLSGLTLGQQGLTATPDLVAQLMSSRRVLAEVAVTKLADGETVASRVADGKALRAPELEARLRELITTNIDKKTGLVALGVVHRDTALARHVVAEVVASTSRTFTSVLRAQASSQRRGQEVRVDSMAAQLRRAEEALLTFQRNNRTLALYAEASLVRQGLERKISVASQAYQQAAAERESAMARELEQTPALVVVDPLPAELRRVPRYTIIYALLGALVGGGLLTIWYLLQALVMRSAITQPASYATVHAAVSRVPVLRRLASVPPSSRGYR